MTEIAGEPKRVAGGTLDALPNVARLGGKPQSLARVTRNCRKGP